MALPQTNELFRERTLGDAVRRAFEVCPQMDPRAVVIFKPERVFWPSPQPIPFSYDFFDEDGKNFATYIPDTESLMIYSRTREWLIEKPGHQDVRVFFQH